MKIAASMIVVLAALTLGAPAQEAARTGDAVPVSAALAEGVAPEALAKLSASRPRRSPS